MVHLADGAFDVSDRQDGPYLEEFGDSGVGVISV
jgi:hypothetical protein